MKFIQEKSLPLVGLKSDKCGNLTLLIAYTFAGSSVHTSVCTHSTCMLMSGLHTDHVCICLCVDRYDYVTTAFPELTLFADVDTDKNFKQFQYYANRLRKVGLCWYMSVYIYIYVCDYLCVGECISTVRCEVAPSSYCLPVPTHSMTNAMD